LHDATELFDGGIQAYPREKSCPSWDSHPS
jgi:hypothetical protein